MPVSTTLSKSERCLTISSHTGHLHLERRPPEIASGPPQDATRRDVDHQPHVVPVEEIARDRVAAVEPPRRLAAQDLSELVLETLERGHYLVRRDGVALYQHGRGVLKVAGRRFGEQQRDARVAPYVEGLVRKPDRGGYQKAPLFGVPEGQGGPGDRGPIPGEGGHLARPELEEDGLHLGRQMYPFGGLMVHVSPLAALQRRAPPVPQTADDVSEHPQQRRE